MLWSRLGPTTGYGLRGREQVVGSGPVVPPRTSAAGLSFRHRASERRPPSSSTTATSTFIEVLEMLVSDSSQTPAAAHLAAAHPELVARNYQDRKSVV